MPDSFFARRLASIEAAKAARLAAIDEAKAAQAEKDRFHRQIPLILDCIEKMGLGGLSEIEIAGLLRHVADELEQIRGNAGRRATKSRGSPRHSQSGPQALRMIRAWCRIREAAKMKAGRGRIETVLRSSWLRDSNSRIGSLDAKEARS